MNNEAEHTLGDDLGRIDLPASVKRKAERDSQRIADKPEPRLRDHAAQGAEAAEAAEAANGSMLREEAVVPAPAPPEREGLISTPEQLRAAREARGLSLLEAANRLRFYPRQLEALESGAWADLPGMAFVRAALRSYARLLEVDVTPLLESLGGYAQPAEIRASASLAAPMPSSGGSLLFGQGGDARRWLPWIVLTVLALVVLAFFFGGGAELAGMRSLVSSDTTTASGTHTVEVQVPPVAAPGAAGAPADTAGAAGAGAGAAAVAGPASRTDAEQGASNGPAASAPASGAAAEPSESQPASGGPQAAAAEDGSSVRLRAAVSLGGSGPRNESAPARSNGAEAAAAPAADAPSGASAATAGTPAATASNAAAAAVTAPASAATGGGLLLTSTREAWVQVREEGGKVLFTGVVQPDQPASIDGTPPFRLTIGRASSVQLTYRGIPVDLRPYTRDDVARLEVR